MWPGTETFDDGGDDVTPRGGGHDDHGLASGEGVVLGRSETATGVDEDLGPAGFAAVVGVGGSDGAAERSFDLVGGGVSRHGEDSTRPLRCHRRGVGGRSHNGSVPDGAGIMSRATASGAFDPFAASV